MSDKLYRNCDFCGIQYAYQKYREKTTRFHSNACRIAYQKQYGQKVLTDEEKQYRQKYTLIQKICIGCGIEYSSKHKNSKYCSRVCGCSHIGKLKTNPWNKGLNKELDDRLKKSGQKSGNTLKTLHASGVIKAWNEGLTKETSPSLLAASEKQKIQRNQEGEWKDNWIEAMRKGQVKAWSEGKYANHNTKPEIKTKEYLEKLGYAVKLYKDKSNEDSTYTWYQQYPFYDSFVPDFACPDLKLIIEVDGCCYHAHNIEKCKLPPKNGQWNPLAYEIAKRDLRKHWLYNNKGWKWCNVWECEINTNDFHRIHKYLDI